MPRSSILVCVFTLAMTALGWAQSPAPSPEPLAPLRLGAVGYLKQETRTTVAPVAAYLEKQLGRTVRLFMYPSYNDVVVRIAQGELDLAILPPIVHLHAADTLPVRTLAYGVYSNRCFTYNALLLARKSDTKIRTLADLKGQKVAFVDLLSASGYVYPKLALEKDGPGAKSVQDKFYGNHVDALHALDEGEVAAAAVYDQMFEEMGEGKIKLDNYHVLARKGPIPSEAIVATTRLDAKIADQVRDLLLCYFASRQAQTNPSPSYYLGFIPPDPSLLDSLRTMSRQLVGDSDPVASPSPGR